MQHVPVHVVWEITLACNLKCQHCGSRAGRPRPEELSTAECIDVVDALAELGTREISLIGGEAYLRKDWVEIIQAIKSYDMFCAIQTGGRALTKKRLTAAAEAGLDGIGVSIDGLEALHDELRGVRGSYKMAFEAIQHAREIGLSVSCNTQISALSMEQLPALMEILIAAGVTHWQIQLTVAMGNAVDNDRLLLQPYEVGELIPLLARLSLEGREKGILMIVGNNIGYYGPYEHILRGAVAGMTPFWTGCAAGKTVIGIESDGVIKGCPSLATEGYAGGNVRDRSLHAIWNNSEEIHFGRLRNRKQLWGFCGDCYYADVCKAGCTWTSDSLLGRPGNNPYCHYRVLELEKQGLRERVVKVMDAADKSFAVGRFELIEEAIPLSPPVDGLNYTSPKANPALSTQHWQASSDRGQPPPKLDMCYGCKCYVWPHEIDCPHCGANIEQEQAKFESEKERRLALARNLEGLLARHQQSGERIAQSLNQL